MEQAEILEELLNGISDEYDKGVGSFHYDILYPVAEMFEQLFSKQEETIYNAFALTATGKYLDNKTAEQNIYRSSGGRATGTVRITGESGKVIQKGIKVCAGGVFFSVDAAAVINAGGYADVSVECTETGQAGNVGAGEINKFPVTISGLYTVTNPNPTAGGYDAEDDESLRERWLEKVSHPIANGDIHSYEAWAKEVEGVGSVEVIPSWNGGGTVKVIITNNLNQPADSELVNAVKNHLDENRIIGAEITVVSAVATEISVSAKLVIFDRNVDEISADIFDVLNEFITDNSHAEYISYAKIGSMILTVEGVADYSNMTLNGTTDNITIESGCVPMLKEVICNA